MSILTKAVGWTLTAFGVFVFIRSKAKHITGLFPAVIGLLLVGLGFASEDEAWSGKATTAAAGVAVAGLLIPVQGLVYPNLFSATASNGQPHPDRKLAQAGTALISAFYLIWVVSAKIARRFGSQ